MNDQCLIVNFKKNVLFQNKYWKTKM